MSILSVDQISPIGSGTTITLNATEIKTGTEITVGTGVSIFSPAGNTLTFGTNNVERIRIKNDGSVLIGTTSEGNSAANNLTIADSGSCGITIRSASSGTGNIYFSDAPAGAAQYDGYIQYNQNDRYLVLGTATAERLRITSTGQLLVGTTSGGGTLRVFGSSGRIIIGDSSVNYYDGDTHIFRNYAASEKLRITSNGDVRIGGGAPTTFGSGTTVHETYNASTFTANLVVSGTHVLQMLASQTHGVTSIGTRSNHNLNLCVNDSTKLTIDTNGNVTKPSNPAFIAGRTGGNQTFTVGTFPLNVTRLNVGNHYNTSTYKFVAPVAGVYYFYGQVYYNNGTGTYRVGFRKTPNGGSALMLNTAQHGVTGNDNQQNISIIESLAVGDTVELYSDQNGSIQCYYNINDTTYGAHTYFMGYLIG